MSQVFITYSSADRNFVEELIDNLRSAGIDVWYAGWEIVIGDSIIRKIQDGIDHSDYLVAVLSPDSIVSPWVQEELETAIAITIDKGAFVLPLLYRDCELPPFLRHRRYTDFRRDRSSAFADLVKTINPHKQIIPTWRPRSEFLIYQTLSGILKAQLDACRVDHTMSIEELQKKFEDEFASLKGIFNLDDATFPFYIQMCMENERILVFEEFLELAPDYITRHPDAHQAITTWMSHEMVRRMKAQD